MNWWMRVHAVLACAAALLICFILAPLLAGSALPIPSLLGGLGSGIPLPLVLPVVPACVVLYAMSRAPRETDAAAVRPVAAYRAALAAGTAVAALALGFCEMQWLDFDLGLGVARNLIGYLGVGLVVQRVVGAKYGPLAAAMTPVGCALIGMGPGRRPYAWAWPLHEATSALAAVVALALFAIGAILVARQSTALSRLRV